MMAPNSATALLVLLASLLVVAHAAPVALTTGDEYPPFTSTKLPEGGMLTDVVRQAFREVGMETTLEWLPWKRGYLSTKIGKYDATFPYLSNAQRAQEMLFSEPLYTVTRYIWAKPDFKGDVENLNSFVGMHYCAPLGYAHLVLFEPLIKAGKLQVETPRDMVTCVKMVLVGRADFFTSNTLNGADAIKGIEGQIVPSKNPVERSTFHLIASRQKPESQKLIDDFNRGLASLKQRGALDQIIKRHGG